MTHKTACGLELDEPSGVGHIARVCPQNGLVVLFVGPRHAKDGKGKYVCLSKWGALMTAKSLILAALFGIEP